MIFLDFRIVEEELDVDLKNDPAANVSAGFILTYFFMPVRFYIDGVEVFEFKNNRSGDYWIELPLLATRRSM